MKKTISYSAKFTLEMELSEFYIFAKPLVDEEALHEAIRSELFHCWMGITGGDWGGNYVDWKKIFFHNLFDDGFIEQTQEGIAVYGKFENK